MLAIESNSALIPIILLIVAFVGTLVSAWQNRRAAATRRAAKASFLVSFSAGLLALVYWANRVGEPAFPIALVVVVPLFFMATVFVISFYLSLDWYQRSNAEED